MFAKNVTQSIQSFKVGDRPFMVDPGQTIQLTDTQAKDETIKILLASGRLEEVGARKATKEILQAEEEKKQAKEEKKIAVDTVNSEKDKTDVAHVVQCSAAKADGSRCNSQISIPAKDFDPEKPYFCGRHKNENPDDYQKEDGVFVKKPAPKQEKPAEKPAPKQEKKDQK